MAKTLYIEYLIAPTQFLAFIFNVQSGYTNVRKGILQIRRYNQWLYIIDKLAVTGYDRRGAVGPEIYTICRNAILGDRQEARVGTFVGLLEIIFGVAFLFLVANTLHINTQNWPKPCIDALLAMEIGLLYILLLVQSIIYSLFTALTDYFTPRRCGAATNANCSCGTST